MAYLVPYFFSQKVTTVQSYSTLCTFHLGTRLTSINVTQPELTITEATSPPKSNPAAFAMARGLLGPHVSLTGGTSLTKKVAPENGI